MNSIIIDDNPAHIVDLVDKLSQADCEVLTTFTHAIEAQQYLTKNDVDVIFLDIDMPELSGFQLLDTLTNPPKVVFVSSHPEYAIDSFDYQPVFFIQKPASIEKILKALSLVENNTSKSDEFFFVREDSKNMKLFYNEVTHISSDKDYIHIHKSDGSHHMVLSTLRNFLKQLPDTIFIRINKTQAININKIEAYNNNDILVNGREMAIGLAYRDAVLQKLSQMGVVIKR